MPIDTRIKAAIEVLEKNRLLYSKEHIAYAEAALQLANLYYQQENGTAQADSLSKEALTFVRQQFGYGSEYYSNALQILPYRQSILIDAYIDLQIIQQQTNLEDPRRAIKWLKLSKAYMANDDSKAYTACLKAYRILEQHPFDQVHEIYDFAYKNLAPSLIKFCQQQLQLETALALDSTAVQTADNLVIVGALHIEYLNNPVLNTKLSTAYQHLSRALPIYAATKGVNSLQYKAAFYLMTNDMQEYYQIEQLFEEILYKKSKPNRVFVQLLEQLVSLHQKTAYTAYSTEHIFERAFRYLENHHGGVRNRYYQSIQTLHQSYNQDNQATVLSKLKQKQELIFLKEGADSEHYLCLEIELLNMQQDLIPEIELLEKYIQILTKLQELALKASDSFELSKYISLIFDPWGKLVLEEWNFRHTKRSKNLSDEHRAQALFEIAWIFLKQDMLTELGIKRYIKGLDLLDKNNLYTATTWLKKLFDYSPQLACKRLGNRVVTQFERLQALPILASAEEQIRQLYSAKSIEYARVLELVAKAAYLDQKTENQLSLHLYNDILTIYETQLGIYTDYIDVLFKICRQIKKMQRWSNVDSRYFFERLLNSLRRKNKDDYFHASFIRSYADWLYQSNQLLDAESKLRDYMKAVSGKTENGVQAVILYQIADILLKTNRLQAARLYFEDGFNLSKQQHQLLAAKCLNGLGQIAQKNDLPSKAMEFYKVSLQYIDNSKTTNKGNDLEQKETLYLQTMVLIGRLLLSQNEFVNAQKYYQQIRLFIKENQAIKPLNTVPLLSLDYATIAGLNDENNKAERYYKLALQNIQKPSEAAIVYQKMAEFYASAERDSLAQYYYHAMLDIDLQQLALHYQNLSESERILYFEPMAKRINQFYNFAIMHPTNTNLIKIWDVHMATKELALLTTTNVQDVCQNTENTVLKRACNSLATLRKEWSESVHLDAVTQQTLQLSIRHAERNIAQQSAVIRQALGIQNDLWNYDTLQKINRADSSLRLSAILDFVVISEQQPLDDSPVSYYYALLMLPDSSSPQMIRLTSEAELQELLNQEVGKNGLNYISDDFESNFLYSLVWEPLQPYLQNLNTIIVCPTALLNKVAFKTLMMDIYSRKRIMDKWSLRYVSSLRDLQMLPTTTNKVETAMIGLIGGVEFDEQGAAQKINSGLSNAHRFEKLPGTLTEIKAIGALFNQQDYIVNELSGSRASEENFYKLIDKAPGILHVASHGFFIEKKPAQAGSANGWNQSTAGLYAQKTAALNDPLLRSGIALAGINRVWREASSLKGLENGILTAMEVASLDLFQTELVVLSACETGRGDISRHEGILGLKRAFKSAGANKLLLSLWKVPDEATAKLMLYFYQDYLRHNKAHKALDYAQQKLRKEYNNPYYWAAFQLTE